jgi:hypothetical protein
MTPDDPGRNRPPYSYVPGGPFPHPIREPGGHSFDRRNEPGPSIEGDDRRDVPALLRGVELFNLGYYWEAHEAWEPLWHALGRVGPRADVIRGLIKLAAAGVKVRERQRHGVVTHAGRAADLFGAAAKHLGPECFGMDLRELSRVARGVAERPPDDPSPVGAPVSIVFAFRVVLAGAALIENPAGSP